MISGIYKIENKINHHLYIGKAKDIKHRWSEHKSAVNINNLNYPLYNAFKKYGIDNFDFSIIEEMSLSDYFKKGSQREKYWINFYNTFQNKNHYNQTAGGEGLFGRTVPEKEKQKISESLKKYYLTEKGQKKAQCHSAFMKEYWKTKKGQQQLKIFSEARKKYYQTQEGQLKAKKHSELMIGKNNPQYQKHSNGKKCMCIETQQIYESTREIEKLLKINHNSISRACRGIQKTAGGYHWQYI